MTDFDTYLKMLVEAKKDFRVVCFFDVIWVLQEDWESGEEDTDLVIVRTDFDFETKKYVKVWGITGYNTTEEYLLT